MPLARALSPFRISEDDLQPYGLVSLGEVFAEAEIDSEPRARIDC
jgi:hypothetical protein